MSTPPNAGRDRPKPVSPLKGNEIPFYAIVVPGTGCLMAEGLGFDGLGWLFYVSPILAFILVRIQNRRKPEPSNLLADGRTTFRLYSFAAVSVFFALIPICIILSTVSTARFGESLPFGYGMALIYGSPVYIPCVIVELIPWKEPH